VIKEPLVAARDHTQDEPAWARGRTEDLHALAAARNLPVRAAEERNEGEIISRREFSNTECVPMAKFPDARIGCERQQLPHEDRTRAHSDGLQFRQSLRKRA
jgi:hypothetical protein